MISRLEDWENTEIKIHNLKIDFSVEVFINDASIFNINMKFKNNNKLQKYYEDIEITV